ncbi:MAG: PIN domain-containing protein, partial [Chloroflexota bacterium]
EEGVILSLFERIPTLSVDRDVAERAAALIRRYPAVFGKGVQRGAADALIAATSWRHNRVLITLNTRQFAKVPIAEVTLQAVDQSAPDWVGEVKV